MTYCVGIESALALSVIILFSTSVSFGVGGARKKLRLIDIKTINKIFTFC